MKKVATVFSCALVVLTAMLLSVGSPLAQEKQAGDAPATAKPARAKPRGRLPNYYRQVVTLEQRDKIYAIQQSYSAQLEALEKQIAELEAKRDAEIEAVLTPEQREKVKTLVQEAQKRREAAAAARKAAAEGNKEPAEAEKEPAQ